MNNTETRRAGGEAPSAPATKPRMNRREAAAYITGKYGFRQSHRTMEALPVPYLVVNGQALYEVADLDTYAQAKLAGASRRMGRGATARSAAI